MSEKTVLIVDDEKDIGMMVSAFVKNAGYQPHYCNSIELAKAKINTEVYDYYLLDLNLPDGTGFDLVPHIKKNNSRPRILIISAYDSSQELSRAREMGIYQFIRKPFTKKELLEALT